MQPRRTLAGLGIGLSLLVAAGSGTHADTVVLKSGKRIEGVVVSSPKDADPVVINPFNSRVEKMTWEIPARNRIPASEVAEVIREMPPDLDYRRQAAEPGLDAEGHFKLAVFCREHKFKDELTHHLEQTLLLDPEHAGALAAYGAGKWQAFVKKHPHLVDADLRRLEAEYLTLTDPEQLHAQWDMMKGTGRELAYLERARRSQAQPRKRRDKVRLTLRSDEAPGATYCIYVPEKYDPLVPTALVVGLHGGGRGGKDGTLVTGSGESAMNFYQQLAEHWGWIVVCPTALRAPWSDGANEPLLEALLEEMGLLYNIDLNRRYLVGHSMGGFGTYHWAAKFPDVWAACAPCAGGGSAAAIVSNGTPIYIYHGGDDNIVGPSSDRSNAKSLAGGDGKKKRKKGAPDFVYTELDGVGHGFPDVVRKDIFEFFAARWKGDRKKRPARPRSSFDAKVGKLEKRTFGDPSELPELDPGDAKVAELVKALLKGGGGGEDAVAQLAAIKEPATVKSVARVLRSKKASVDTRVLAARALGEIGLPEGIKPLAGAVKAEDYRIVDAATTALGKIGTEDAVTPLTRMGAEMGRRFDESYYDSEHMVFTEYTVRLESFQRLLDAFAAVGDADAFMPVIEDEIVNRVLLGTKRAVPKFRPDSRFDHIPPEARVKLMQHLTACLVKLARGRGLLEQVKAAWKHEPRVVQEADAGIAKLGS